MERLPKKIFWKGLSKIFGYHGHVINAFIPRKRSMRGQCFGFVRFPKFAEARRAIAKLNGYVVFGSQVFTRMARFNRRSSFWRKLKSQEMGFDQGDGPTIRGWKDFWVPEVGPLFSYVPAHASLDLESTLRDWVLLDGFWNVYLLHIWLPDDVIKHIVSIPILILQVVRIGSFGLDLVQGLFLFVVLTEL
ncbi:hypothetical protein Goklo_009014 [Gossypium klotzschianum]|uniref:RRM domain-containing protein n=1 Tax=Gossypium klotzschianum TaxID=34286 RepID=A0A7J8V1J7_9ROSI|nr:hypothetical protein [Gossypium klotzschianum]